MALRSSQIVVDIQRTLGTPPYLLCEVTEDYIYENGKRGELRGYKYHTAFPERSLEKLCVKIPGPKQVELAEGAIEDVVFDGLEMRPYVNNAGQISLTAQAASISIVTSKK